MTGRGRTGRTAGNTVVLVQLESSYLPFPVHKLYHPVTYKEKLPLKIVSKVGICVRSLRMLRTVMYNKLCRFTSLQLGVIYAHNYVEWTMADSDSSNVSFPQHKCWFIKQLCWLSAICFIVLNVRVNWSQVGNDARTVNRDTLEQLFIEFRIYQSVSSCFRSPELFGWVLYVASSYSDGKLNKVISLALYIVFEIIVIILHK